MGAVVAGAGPAHALFFGTYEYTKALNLFPNHQQINYSKSQSRLFKLNERA